MLEAEELAASLLPSQSHGRSWPGLSSPKKEPYVHLGENKKTKWVTIC